MNCQPLYEAYRPKTWSEIIGQPKAIAKLDRFRKRRGTLAGDCYFLSGSSGTGKTSIALLIAEETSDPWTLTEFDDPSELTAYVKLLKRCRNNMRAALNAIEGGELLE